ncbi:murein hydrolase activator EnvC family protein [Desulfitobacterium sp.]|uniref:murein hydrolase activator EnvC family protein n=1 Tax=Desulfitobacterium sp. TaxID=49981 RepID=UPI002B1F22C7|nr:peptidoglycan DD-metalloendopeptidase family protein [Desulfitobacterium sp.]MEA4900994.1 peptidoglycan DD-metalloendopeptidase family protein [Desulfitobacterium sp.]
MYRKWVVSLIISGTLLGSTVLPLQAGELNDAMDQQKGLQQKQNQIQGKLNDLTYSEDKLKTQIQTLSTQITSAKAELSQKQESYNQAQKKVAASEKELEKRNQALEERRGVLQKRVRVIYEEGQLSYLEILFQSTDLSDFITRLEYFTRLVENDQKILADIQTEKENIEQKTKELQSQRDQAAELQVQAAKVKSDLDSKNQQYQTALNDNKKAQDALSEQNKQLAKDSAAIAEKIRQLTSSSSGKVLGTINTYPLPGYYEVSSPYGWRIHPVTGEKSLHTGTDIPAPGGTAILAAGTGKVIMAGWYGAYGNAVIIDHGGGYTSLYGHQSRIGVSVGDQVKAGDVIGYVGTTGWSTGNHLHFEVRVNGNPTDPLQFFR